MANVNPGVTLSGASAAGPGSAIDMMGAATGVAGIRRVSLIGNATTFTATFDPNTSMVRPVFTIGLEVSSDNSVWVRVATVSIGAAGQAFSTVSPDIPCRYARATIDALESRISAIAVTASVCGA